MRDFTYRGPPMCPTDEVSVDVPAERLDRVALDRTRRRRLGLDFFDFLTAVDELDDGIRIVRARLLDLC